ncbi:DMT family transporter [Streptomyces marispadix]|uniref:DMT family transporter n=1 Tax=Streptomyces marispadix TaxID=2922868 RepID=A0ABS9SVK0_9ACTN|nr:DMT family transporter [Streptomyces marispadix]MCH6160306.1 DMT family transporter [Streptomyces marispadix]
MARTDGGGTTGRPAPGERAERTPGAPGNGPETGHVPGPGRDPGRAPGTGRARASRQGGPALMVVAGAACTSSSGMFIKLSEVNAGTAAFLRCALALAVLAPMALVECRRIGRRPGRLLALDLAAGTLLGLDYVCWVRSIHDLGAGVATLLLNVQLIVFPLLARFLTGVRLARRFWLTAFVLLAGLALAGGAIGRPEPGTDPLSGVLFGTIAGVAFAGYLFLIRLGGDGGRAGDAQLPSAASPEELRGGAEVAESSDRTGDGTPLCPEGVGYAGGTGSGAASTPVATAPSHTVTPVCAATFAAAVAAGVLGALWTGVDVDPGWPAWGWLIPMAFLGQVVAWLLINPALPRLAPDKGATLLLLQPILAILFGVGFLAERPTLSQYAGCVLVVLAIWRTTRTDH